MTNTMYDSASKGYHNIKNTWTLIAYIEYTLTCMASLTKIL
jgi:hypothetical protein